MERLGDGLALLDAEREGEMLGGLDMEREAERLGDGTGEREGCPDIERLAADALRLTDCENEAEMLAIWLTDADTEEEMEEEEDLLGLDGGVNRLAMPVFFAVGGLSKSRIYARSSALRLRSTPLIASSSSARLTGSFCCLACSRTTSIAR